MEERFEDYKTLLEARQQSLSAWELISLVGSGHFSKGMDKQTLSMGINEVFLELILDVLKQVGARPRTQTWPRPLPVVLMKVLMKVPVCLCRAT